MEPPFNMIVSNNSAQTPPEARLRTFIGTLVKRMAGIDGSTSQARLMMREMLQPTNACREIVEAYLRPEFNLLLDILRELLPDDVPEHVPYQVGFSVVGQCLFYRVAGDVVRFIVPPRTVRRALYRRATDRSHPSNEYCRLEQNRRGFHPFFHEPCWIAKP